MTEAVFRLPLTLELKPSRCLRHLLMASSGAAALLLLATPGVSYWLSGGGVVACIFLYASARRPAMSRQLVLLPDGCWIPPGASEACALSASSVDLFGILWLHGRAEDGQRHAVMVTQDAPDHPQGWRWLCIWYRNAPGAGGQRPDGAGV